MGKIIDGFGIAKAIRARIAGEIKSLNAAVGLAVVLAGDDGASQIYVKNKIKACEEAGICSFLHRLPQSVSEEELLNLVATLNADSKVHGILVQLPLPKGIDAQRVLDSIDPKKDVDGFHPLNAGALFLGMPALYPCTPLGCIELLKSTNVPLSGKHAVVIGRSNIVGKPMAMLLLRQNCTVTVCHSATKDLSQLTRQADIVVAAIGKPKFLKADMVKEGAIVIDVGINRDESGKLCGDADFAGLEQKCSFITPVPRGVGPMTIAMLLENTLSAYHNINRAIKA